MTVPFTGAKWGGIGVGKAGGVVTWSFATTSLLGLETVVNQSTFQNAIKAAFDTWQKLADIDFRQVADNGASNITLVWNSIDGVNGKLGYAEWEYSGSQTIDAKVTFDRDDAWDLNGSVWGNNFYAVAVHEVGHAIGLAHANETTSIMYPYLSSQTGVSASDIVAIQTLYGVNPNYVPPPVLGTDRADVLKGTMANDVLRGFGGDDTLIGNGGDDRLDGGTGADTMSGGAGNDIYYVDNGRDRVAEAANAGTDTVVATVSVTLSANVERLTFTGTAALNGVGNTLANVMTGNAGNNSLNGGAGNDVLSGGAGNDRLFGGAGLDTLIGGKGNDAFVFNTRPGPTNVDTVRDFHNAPGDNDLFQLENAVFTALTKTGALAAGAFAANAAGRATQADDRIVYDTDSGNLFYDADGSGAGAAVRIATLTGHPTLTYHDFFVI